MSTPNTYNAILATADRIGVAPTKEQMDVEGYEALQMVLQMAYEQASGGKGNERHASNGLSERPFHGQPMQTECDEIGSVDGLVYQVRKKTREGNKLPTTNRQVNEWLGAINYLAGCVIWKLRHEEQAGEGALRVDGDATYEGQISSLTSDPASHEDVTAFKPRGTMRIKVSPGSDSVSEDVLKILQDQVQRSKYVRTVGSMADFLERVGQVQSLERGSRLNGDGEEVSYVIVNGKHLIEPDSAEHRAVLKSMFDN